MIRAPYNKPLAEIQRIIQIKKRWIFKKQLEFKERTIGEYAHKKYTKGFLIKRVNFYASKIGVYPLKINVKKLRSRWGSTTKDSVINLNQSLLKAPKNAIDYVILHEICHLKIKDHSYRFWKLLQKFMPNYLQSKRWLEVNSNKIID